MADATERWLPVVGYEGWYEVSDHGRVRRVARGSRTRPGFVLAPRPTRQGYRQVALFRYGQRRDRKVHQLVLESFIGPCPRGHECNHQDGDKANNCLGNLEWATPKANAQHAIRLGLRTGTHTPRLTWPQVVEIRRLAGLEPVEMTAARFGVSESTVYAIRSGRTWRR